MLNFKNEYFSLEKGRLKYPTQFKDKSFLVVYGSKESGVTGTELTAHIYKIPENYYEINAGQLDFSNYPNGIENDFLTIRVTNLDSLFSLPLNFTDWKDISPENLTTTFEKIGVSILDIQKRLSEVAIYIDSGKPDQINLPKLPVGCTWYKDQDENIVALPISDLYGKFQQMIDKLHKNIKDLLDIDYGKLSNELRNDTDELLKELNDLNEKLKKSIFDLSNEEQKKIVAEGEKQTKLVIAAGEGLMPRVEKLETENSTNKQNIGTNKQEIINLTNNKLNKGSLPATIIDAKEIYDLLENNSGLNFDKNLLFLNDKGVKTQGKIYFDRNKVGMFECIKTTPEDYVANSTTYFVDISNKSSSDRLSNLYKIGETSLLTEELSSYAVGQTITLKSEISLGILLLVSSGFESNNTFLTSNSSYNGKLIIIQSYNGNIILEVQDNTNLKILKLPDKLRRIKTARVLY